MKNYTALCHRYGDIAINRETGDIKSYIKFDMLHLDGLRKTLRDIKYLPILICKNMRSDEYQIFFKKLIKFEKEHEYKYTKESIKKKYKTIYAVKLEILLPRKIKTKADMIKFTSHYMQELNPVGYRIPWIAYIVQRNSATYINILLSEREYIDGYSYRRYNRNYYTREGKTTHKRGDFILNKTGHQIKVYISFSSKARIFVFDRSFTDFTKLLFQYFTLAVKKTIKKIDTRFFLKIRKLKRVWQYFNRKCVIEINNAKRYIEYMCNYAVDLMRASVMDLIINEYIKSVPTPKYKEITSLFIKYKKRFDKSSFHDFNGLLREIPYRNVPLNRIRENIAILINEFTHEIKLIVPKIMD